VTRQPCYRVGVRLERRDGDLHPGGQRQGIENAVEPRFAVGAVQAERAFLSPGATGGLQSRTR
jgi:hypothetical protein